MRHLPTILLLVAPLIAVEASSSEKRDFQVKYGVMEPATATKDRLRETRTVTMEPARRPGWCFLVDPPDSDSYEVYSIHYLSSAPRVLTGDFKDKPPAVAPAGIPTRPERGDGIRPFCFDFHRSDPLGKYRVEVFINGALKTTLELNVIAPGAEDSDGK